MVWLFLLLVPSLWCQEVPSTGPNVNLPLESRTHGLRQPGMLEATTPLPIIETSNRHQDQLTTVETPNRQGLIRDQAFTLRPGEVLNLFLDGDGWIYESLIPELGSPQRERVGNGVRFRFQPRTEGNYQLMFQRQDPVQGQIQYQRVILTVRNNRPEPQVDLSLENRTSSEPMEQVIWGRAQRYHTLGQLQELYRYLDANRQVQSARLSELRAFAAEGVGRNSEALEHWARAVELSAEDVKSEYLVKALVSAARLKDGLRLAQFWSWYDQFFKNQRPNTLDEVSFFLIAQVALERASGIVPEFLELWSQWYPESLLEDQWLFLKGRWLEGEKRDYQQALVHFIKLIEKYPLSSYYRSAQERVANLRGQFFLVR